MHIHLILSNTRLIRSSFSMTAAFCVVAQCSLVAATAVSEVLAASITRVVLSWWWRQQTPLKCTSSNTPHGIMTQKAATSIPAAMRTWNLTSPFNLLFPHYVQNPSSKTRAETHPSETQLKIKALCSHMLEEVITDMQTWDVAVYTCFAPHQALPLYHLGLEVISLWF
jgi:hypothetical protein